MIRHLPADETLPCRACGHAAREHGDGLLSPCQAEGCQCSGYRWPVRKTHPPDPPTDTETESARLREAHAALQGRVGEMLAELEALKPCGSHPLYSAGWQDGVNAAIEVVARGVPE